MIGRRIPVLVDENGNEHLPPEFWANAQPGDYCGPIKGYTGEKLAVFFLKPNARDPDAPSAAHGYHHVTSPPHVFRECSDGSLEIRESINDKRASPPDASSDGWHGYLDMGHVWRQV